MQVTDVSTKSQSPSQMTFCRTVSHPHLINRVKQPCAPGVIPLIFGHFPPLSERHRFRFSSSAEARCFFFSFPLPVYTNWSFFVCHFDECPGPFHRVQMWGSPDPSWFQESIGVHKGRVNVYLLPWCDTESAQKERQTDLKLGHRVCACVCLWNSAVQTQVPLFFHTYSCFLHQHRPTFKSEPAAITVPEGRLDCLSKKKMLGIANVLSPLDVESPSNENIKRTL